MNKMEQIWTPCTIFFLIQGTSGLIIVKNNNTYALIGFDINLVLTRAQNKIGSKNIEVYFSYT